ncbi:hypothetical protein ACFVXC_06150 [Streptomyces sp. NPDC058257]|uniref:hypothetical protein n=1 Tax=Streptomyces sp. NPDC058257 TaxID=3346409 RepID=UPI0036E673CF
MNHRSRQIIIGIAIGLAVAIGAIVAAQVIGGGGEDGGLDKRSYTLGYKEAFGGAYMPTDTRSRDAIRASCDDLFRSWVQASGKQNVVRSDWVEGCADVAQNKDSRF